MCICTKILVPFIILILLPQILVGHQEDLLPRIINGYQCDTTKIPFFVIILHQILCGGSLLTYEWVLTASHCIRPKLLEGKLGEVHSGFDLASEFRQMRYIKETYLHPNYNVEDSMSGKDLRNDIGLIKLGEPFDQNSAIGVGTFPSPGFTKQCSEVMAAGIGITYNDENFTRSEVLKRPIFCVNLTIEDICKQSYPHATLDENVFCAYAENKDTCLGDSGGPIVCDNVIIGIVSFGPTPCGGDSRAGTYTKIEGFYDFINPIIKSEISIKHGRFNDTSGNVKRGNGESGNVKGANGTSGIDKKKPRASNVVQALVANWKLILISLLYYFLAVVLYP